MIHRRFFPSIAAIALAGGTMLAPVLAGNDPLALEMAIRKEWTKSEAVIDAVEFYGVRIDAERRFSYKVEAYREHLFIRLGSGGHSGWAEMNLGENVDKLPFDKRTWRLKWYGGLKGKTFAEALDLVIAQRDKASYTTTECAEMALLDLAGKSMGVPALDWLGLGKRDPVPGMYAILSDDPEKVRSEAKRAWEQKLRSHLKVKLYGKLETDLGVIAAAREVFGDEGFLIGDANTGYRKELAPEKAIDDLLPAMKSLQVAGLSSAEDPANLSVAQWAALQKAVVPLELCPDVPTRPAWKSIESLSPEMGAIFNMHPAGMGSIIQTVRLGRWIQSHGKRVMVGDSSLVGPACPAWEQIAIGLGADWVEAIEKPQENHVFQDCQLENPVGRSTDGAFVLEAAKPGFGVKIDRSRLREAAYEHLAL